MSTPKSDRGPILAFKLLIPERLWRLMTKPASLALKAIPNKLLYAAGAKARAGRFPYKVIEDGDVVVQIGAPRDLLSVGRSRSAYFMQFVNGGTLVVMEPDPDSAQALRDYVAKNGFEDRVLIVEKGAWSSETELVFLSSPLHPAANLIEGAEDITDEELKRRDYQKIRINVVALDEVLKAHNLKTPKLVSITANGSESEILKGMSNAIADGLPYISLAITGEKYPEMMAEYGYENIALDDRGFTFQQKSKA